MMTSDPAPQRRHWAIISLGSNIDPERHIERALHRLKKAFTVEKEAPPVWTKPVNCSTPHLFLNAAVRIRTDCNEQELKETLKLMEKECGRDDTQGPESDRCIDLDLVVWEGHLRDNDVLTRDFLGQLVQAVWPKGIPLLTSNPGRPCP